MLINAPDGMTGLDVARATGLSCDTIYRLIARLKAAGELAPDAFPRKRPDGSIIPR